MKRLMHGSVVAAVIGITAFGYSSAVRASSDAGGSSAEDFEVTGIIDDINENSITVDGVEYAITDSTESEGLLQIGSQVEVEYVIAEDGTLTALEIEGAEEELEEDDSQELQGDDDEDEAEDQDDDEHEDEDDADEDDDDDDEEDHSGGEHDDDDDEEGDD